VTARRGPGWPFWFFALMTLGLSVETTFWLWRGDWLMVACGFVPAVAAAAVSVSYLDAPCPVLCVACASDPSPENRDADHQDR
jgi:hypothetical protein